MRFDPLPSSYLGGSKGIFPHRDAAKNLGDHYGSPTRAFGKHPSHSPCEMPSAPWRTPLVLQPVRYFNLPGEFTTALVALTDGTSS